MKRAGLVSYAIVVAFIVMGSIAVAAPSFRAALHAPLAAAETGTTGSSGPGDGTGPTGGSGPIETPAPLAPEEEGDGEGEAAPDFTACDGMTGLDNAICRHEALLVVHPDNRDLQHSLERLDVNRERHEAKQHSKAEERSEDDPGNGNGHGHAHGHSYGHDHDKGGAREG
jgi:hypothetical protein